MMDTAGDTSPVQHMADLMKGFDTGMLVTHTPDGGLRARPMAIAEVRDDGDVYFATNLDSPKVKELDTDNRVNVTLQADRRFVSLSGRVRVLRDRGLINRLWSEAWRVWFPEGKEDPSLCILAVRTETGEFWDQTGAKGLRYAWDAAKALLRGTTPHADQEQHAKVAMGQ